MKITCQSCHSKYNVADEKVQGKIVKIRCRKCGGTIVVNGNAGTSTSIAPGSAAPASLNANGARAPEESVSPPAAADPQAAVWHVNLGEGEPQTMSMSELVAAYNAGTVTQDMLVWSDGMEEWKPLAETEPVVTALHLHASNAQQLAAAQPSAEQPQVQSDEPDASTAYFARPAPPADDHATYAAAAAAPAPAPEPKRAAVMRRETRGRDLFSTYAQEELQASAQAASSMVPPPQGDDSKLTGQRNENSVLFSLGALTKNVDERALSNSASVKDDSGIIDLKALVQRAESMRPAARNDADLFAPALGFASPPIGSPLGPLDGAGPEGQAKSKLPALIAAVAGIGVLLVLGIVIGVKIAGAGSAAVVPTASAAASIAVPAASASPDPASSASAAASVSAAPSASIAAKPKPIHAGSTGPAVKPSGVSGTSPVSATPLPPSPQPKKTGGDCGCNGDLMCLMKCSTH